MRMRRISWLPAALLLGLIGCAGVQKDLYLPRDFQPRQYQQLAVLNLDPQVVFSEYAEAELLKKGYKVKEHSLVRQVLRKEGLTQEESLEPQALARLGGLLGVQGIVLCRVLEFSRFRDAYRLSIKMVDPASSQTVWSAQGFLEGKKGMRSSELLRQIVHSTLKDLPPVPE
ncbi:MAG: hypothetical protein HY697_02990 [Deltaproteobacteria bacterium]|nr:hypothetical protein [Deltaproteobacteria bacterium]